MWKSSGVRLDGKPEVGRCETVHAFKGDQYGTSMHFRKGNTDQSIHIRKANTDPSMHFRKANTEFLLLVLHPTLLTISLPTLLQFLLPVLIPT